MRKLKRVAASALAVAMATTMATGCSSSSDSATTAAGSTTAAAGSEAATTAEAKADEGKVLNVYCWNKEFSERIIYVPGYEAADKEDYTKGGTLNGVKVVFTIVPSDDNAYQDNLDKTLKAQADAAADDKIDIFLVEADYALKYVDTDYTMAVKDLGITDADLADQYSYTQDIMTDSKGVLKGVSWQGCPGLMFYNRDIAKEVLGTDDPAEVQKYVSDWNTYNETAKKVNEAGYLMQPSVNDTYRVYSNNVSKAWVDENKTIQIDDNIKAWVDSAKALYDAGYTTNDALWDGYANATNGGCFAAFGPAWLINFCFGYDGDKVAAGTADMTNVANAGKWGACNGPQGFYWGGTWICAATGTDNEATIATIMKSLTCDASVAKEIVEKCDDFTNNKKAMEELAASDYSSYILGGQNPLGLYAAGAEKIKLDNLTNYDQGCNEAFQNAMSNYFDDKSTYEEALDAFYNAVLTKYPALKRAE